MGADVRDDYRKARRMLGVVPQELVFDPFFSVRETLRIQSGYFGLRRNEGYTVAGINQLPLLPGILVALAFLLALGTAWWREGR